MSDGSSGNAFGEALESMSTNTKKAIGGTIADFKNSVKGQVAGSGGLSGSFTPSQQSQPQNPHTAPSQPNLSGGDLFSPDMTVNKPKPQGQNPQGPKPLTQAGQQLAQNPENKNPEEVKKIQAIEQELRSLHQKYYQDFLAKAEGRDRKTQMETQEKKQEEQDEKMEDLQKKEEKKQEDQSVFRAKRSSEIKGGLG